jgi:hypothetical protein
MVSKAHVIMIENLPYAFTGAKWIYICQSYILFGELETFFYRNLQGYDTVEEESCVWKKFFNSLLFLFSGDTKSQLWKWQISPCGKKYRKIPPQITD